jgi:hypothetical protein
VSGSAWGIVWLAVALKLPIVALLYLVWWAIKDPPGVEAEEDGGGSPDRDPRPHPRGPMPGPPRRGQHAGSPPSSPARVRTLRGRRRVPAGHK